MFEKCPLLSLLAQYMQTLQSLISAISPRTRPLLNCLMIVFPLLHIDCLPSSMKLREKYNNIPLNILSRKVSSLTGCLGEKKALSTSRKNLTLHKQQSQNYKNYSGINQALLSQRGTYFSISVNAALTELVF